MTMACDKDSETGCSCRYHMSQRGNEYIGFVVEGMYVCVCVYEAKMHGPVRMELYALC